MNQDIQIIDPCTSEEWLRFVTGHPAANIFHHPSWIRVLRDTYHYPMFAVCVVRDGRIQAGVPFADVHSPLTGYRWVSLPFSDNCPPLLPADDPAATSALLGFLQNQLSRSTPRIEFHWDVRITSSHCEKNFVQHILDLRKTSESLFNAFDKRTTQRSIRIAEKSSIVVRECKTQEEFDAFYDLQVKTRKRLGVPVQPRALFNNIWKNIIQPGMGFALVTSSDDTPVAGGVFLSFNGTLSCKYSASDAAFKALQPTHAFIWDGIKKGVERGCSYLDFGRSDIDNQGLRRFKKNWGAVEQELCYTTISRRQLAHRNHPLQALLRQIVRHSPEFVCKAAGNILYKHFA